MQPLQPTPKDIEIIEWVYQCRRAHIPHLVTLTGRSRQKLNSRLVRLVEQGYLHVLKRPFQHYIYSIGRRATPILVERGIATHVEVERRVRVREASELFLNHEMMLVDVHVSLVSACRENNINLKNWQEGADLYDSVWVRKDGERIKLPVRPDAFFTLEEATRPDGNTPAHFFVEVDRRTTTQHARFQRKITAYTNYYAQGLHTKKYGIKNFRVLTIATSEARAHNLCETVSETIPRKLGKFYYFAPVSHFLTENHTDIFKDIFVSPRDFNAGKRYHLIPPVAPIATTA